MEDCSEDSPSETASSNKSLWSRLSPIPHLVAAQLVPSPAFDVLQVAKDICKAGIDGMGPPQDPRVTDLTWGGETRGKSQIGDRVGAVFYRLSVDKRHVDAGFFILCRGANSRSVFRLLLLDSSGEVVIEEESSNKPDKSTHTEAAIYCTRFETFRNVAPPASTSDPSALLSMLDSFQPCSIAISTGQYLLCVQCTNILGLPTHFTVTTVLANAAVDALKSVNEEILSHKPTLDALRMEYEAAKASYESAVRQLRDEGAQLTTLLDLKEKLHTAFVDSSIQAYKPAVSMEDHQQESNPSLPPDNCAVADQPDGVGQGAVGLAVHAAKTATEAWGGIARRWSLGVSQVKLFTNHSFVSSHRAAEIEDVSAAAAADTIATEEVEFDIDTSSGSEASDESPSPSPSDGDVFVSLSAADPPSEG